MVKADLDPFANVPWTSSKKAMLPNPVRVREQSVHSFWNNILMVMLVYAAVYNYVKEGECDWNVKVQLSLYVEHLYFSTCYAVTPPFNILAFSEPHLTDVFGGSSVVRTTVGGPPQARTTKPQKRTQSKCRFKNSPVSIGWMYLYHCKPPYACAWFLNSIHHLWVRIWLHVHTKQSKPFSKYKLYRCLICTCSILKAFMCQQPLIELKLIFFVKIRFCKIELTSLSTSCSRSLSSFCRWW